MKKISKIPLGFVLGILVSLTINVTAETLIDSGAVSYSNSNTSETTVDGALNELFSAVDINNRLGSTDISSIGDGTITGAILNINNTVSELNNNSQNTTTVIEANLQPTTGFTGSPYMVIYNENLYISGFMGFSSALTATKAYQISNNITSFLSKNGYEFVLKNNVSHIFIYGTQPTLVSISNGELWIQPHVSVAAGEYTNLYLDISFPVRKITSWLYKRKTRIKS